MFSNIIKKDTKNRVEAAQLDPQLIPDHVAIIMDGNGRWAQNKHLPRVAGHKQGMEVVETITEAASDLGIKVLSLYAFSTENWRRPNEEVNYLMGLPNKFFSRFVPKLIRNNVRVNVIGDQSQLPEKTQEAVNNAIADTKDCTGMVLNFALNYGSRSEILSAVKAAAIDVKKGRLEPETIDEQRFSQYLMTASLAPYGDPDLLIRTSGEQRISNFLLWQIAYSELVFTDVYWPDYQPEDLYQDLLVFQKRDRRFGGIKPNEGENKNK
ncbi:UDP pyrophosphate synthase [Ligilactobacillus salitolerans]|uniref:Isoprenyl transferase n=1 Tax=Ligilactobacillus salitolerans TaxID=1808352 RepID=A0A401IRJ3_9LACO|nr:isoprenyl transferase [Ligilactobacillus salitolerans]GBG94146.1 UDP pyrophosphate synthase [Ligilactobacillus salitolerans]